MFNHVKQSVRHLKSLTKPEIRNLLNNSTWASGDLLKKSAGSSVDLTLLRRMLKLSGLSTDILKEQEEDYLQSLRAQVNLFENLYDGTKVEALENNSHFRLIASDHVPEKPLTLTMLKKKIAELRANDEKGEGAKFLLGEHFKIKRKDV